MKRITVQELTCYGIVCPRRSPRWQFPLMTFDTCVMIFLASAVLTWAMCAGWKAAAALFA